MAFSKIYKDKQIFKLYTCYVMMHTEYNMQEQIRINVHIYSLHVYTTLWITFLTDAIYKDDRIGYNNHLVSPPKKLKN